jgi:hypothetical protein
MADETGPPLVSLAGGAFSGRVDSSLRESAQSSFYNLLSVDAGALGAGATISGSQNSQALGYQLQAANTWFSTVAAGAACVLPQTSRPFPFAGLMVFVVNTGANTINCYPHPSDPSNSINGQSANTPVVLGANTITPFQCFTPGVWFADSIGTGFAGSLETVVSQGAVATAGTTSGTATQITQAMVNVTSGGAGPAGITLPPAKAGMQVSVGNNNSATILTVYGNGADTIAGSASTTQAASTIVIYMCFTSGNWVIK